MSMIKSFHASDIQQLIRFLFHIFKLRKEQLFTFSKIFLLSFKIPGNHRGL